MIMLSGFRDRKVITLSKKIIMLLVAFPIIGLLIICNNFYYDIVSIKAQYNEDVQKIQGERAEAVFNMFEGIRQEEIIHNQYIISKIISDIDTSYGNNMEALKVDLHSEKSSPIYTIFDNVIKYDREIVNRYTFIPKSSSLFIADKNGILADSGYVNRELHSRKWNEEIESNKYKELTKNAISMLVNQDPDLIYWETDEDRSVYSHNLIVPNEPNDHTIKQLILDNDINSLRNFNILIPSYITDTGDIFGVADINDHGLRNDNDKIIIVREINMYDAIAPYMGKVSIYDYLINKYDTEVKSYVHTKTVTFLALSVICMIIVIVILYIANTKFADNRGDEYDGLNITRR